MDFGWLAKGIDPIEMPDPMQGVVRGLTIAQLARNNRVGEMDERNKIADRRDATDAAKILARAQTDGWPAAIQEGKSNPRALVLAIQLRRKDQNDQADFEKKQADTGKVKADTKKTDTETLLKLAEPLGSEAAWLAKHPNLSPDMVAKYNAKIANVQNANGVRLGDVLPPIDPENPRDGLMSHSRMFFNVKDQVAQAATDKQHGITNDLNERKFADESKDRSARRGMESQRIGIERERLGLEREKAQGKYDKADQATTERNRQHVDMANRVLDMVREVKPQVSGRTAGMMGVVGSKVPGSAATDVEAKLETIRANLGFEQLQQMRMASPTGGALGQVSDFENRSLQAAIASLQQRQSPAQLKANLDKVEKHLSNVIELINGTYKGGKSSTKGGALKTNPDGSYDYVPNAAR